jgi:hypothetical protein
MVEIGVDDAMPKEMREYPAFIKLLEREKEWFNNPDKFTRAARMWICLHEGSHLFFDRAIGFQDSVLRGPWISYNPEHNKFLINKSSVCSSASFAETLAVETHLMAKTFIAPSVVGPALMSHPRTALQTEWDTKIDFELCRAWYTKRVINTPQMYEDGKLDASDLTEEILDSTDEVNKWWNEKTQPGYDKLIAETRIEILHDLRSPSFRKRLWDTAREFESKVFRN